MEVSFAVKLDYGRFGLNVEHQIAINIAPCLYDSLFIMALTQVEAIVFQIHEQISWQLDL